MERAIGYRIFYGDYWESEQPFADNPLLQPGEKMETTIRATETGQDIPGPSKPVHYSILLKRIESSQD
jgi:hypothetical protein